MAAGVLLLSLTFGAMLIRLGHFQGTESGVTTTGIASTLPATGQSRPLAARAPAARVPSNNGVEQGDGTAGAGSQGRTSSVIPARTSTPAAMNGSSVPPAVVEE
jgi:hypothetical protein